MLSFINYEKFILIIFKENLMMKKLLLAILVSTTLVACNSGGSTTVDNTIPEPVVPVPVDTFYMQFDKQEITLKKNESADVTLQLYRFNTTTPYPTLPPLFIDQSESGVVNIDPEFCVLDVNYQCKLHITALVADKNIYVYPVIPEEYNYIEVLNLTVHTESAESAQ